MSSSRVLLVGRLLVREMIEELVRSEADIKVVGSVEFGVPLASEVDRTEATIVVLADGENQINAACDELLPARPHLMAVAVIDRGRENVLYELKPLPVPLGPLMPEALIALLRPPHPGSEAS
jgi:hypothetical protein